MQPGVWTVLCSAAPRLNSSCLKLIWLAPVNQRDGCGAISGCGGLTRHHYTSGLQLGIEVHWYSLASFSLHTFEDSSRPYFKLGLAFKHHLSTWNLHWVVVWIVKTLKTLPVNVHRCHNWRTLDTRDAGTASCTRNTGAGGRGRGS